MHNIAKNNSIRINHECEGGIEKSVLRITDLHHDACGVMTNGDRKGWMHLRYTSYAQRVHVKTTDIHTEETF